MKGFNILIGLCFLVLLGFCNEVRADSYSTSEMYDNCKVIQSMSENKTTSVDGYKASYCVGYFTGLAEMHDAMSVVTDVKMYCTPDGVNYEQTILMFLKYVDENPEIRHKKAILSYIDFLHKSFPCE